MRKTTSTKVAVLRKLLDSDDKTLSGGKISKGLGLSRQAVWKVIRSLKEDGYRIESIPVKGYRLHGPSENDLDPSWIELLLADCPWGHPTLFWEEIDSTQIPAKELARQGASEGLIVVANHQISGRGRLGRNWISPPDGGIYFSVIIRPALSPEQIQTLSLVSAISVQDAIFCELGIQCQLKWPNDILWEDAKVCGILSEVSSEPGKIHYAVTGIGINANMKKGDAGLDGSAASLSSIVNRRVDRGEVLAAVIRRFHDGVRKLESGKGIRDMITEYSRRCSTIGKIVRVIFDNREIIGKACGIGDKGDLLVEAKGETLSFSAADIIHLRTCTGEQDHSLL